MTTVEQRGLDKGSTDRRGRQILPLPLLQLGEVHALDDVVPRVLR